MSSESTLTRMSAPDTDGDPAAGRRPHGRLTTRLQKTWWMPAGFIAVIAAAMFFPVSASNLHSPAPSEGLVCSNGTASTLSAAAVTSTATTTYTPAAPWSATDAAVSMTVNQFAGQTVASKYTATSTSGAIYSTAAPWTASDSTLSMTPNAFAGATVTAGASTGVVQSNTPTILTLTSAGWTGGTPTAGTTFTVTTTTTAKVVSNSAQTLTLATTGWSNGVPANGTPFAITIPQRTTRNFVLTAQEGYITTPDGNSIYMWGYAEGNKDFQYPGPFLCANEGDQVTVTLHNHLGAPYTTNKINAPTSIVWTGIPNVLVDGIVSQPTPVPPAGPTNSLSQPVAVADSATYTFTAGHPGTFVYESGTDAQLQVQMGLVGGLVVHSSTQLISAAASTTYTASTATDPSLSMPTDAYAGDTIKSGTSTATVLHNTATVITLAAGWTGAQPADHTAFTITGSYKGAGTCQDPYTASTVAYAYDDPYSKYNSCQEYTSMLSEVDPDLHHAIETGQTSYDWSKYNTRYYFINGRTFPDDISPNGISNLPNQPYGALVHVQPRSATNPNSALIRYLNVGPVGYPFHPHSNHDSTLGIDGHELVNPAGQDASFERFGLLIAPGQTVDAVFTWEDAQQWAPDTNPVQVPVPDQQDRFEGTYWNGTPYLGDRQPLATGVVRYNECGELMHVAHSHALFQLTNFGFSGGGMLTMVRVDPPQALQDKYGTHCTVPGK